MKQLGTFKKIIFSALLIIGILSCSTIEKNKEEPKKAVLIEHPERMFWEIKKENSSIYILGTLHFADTNFFPLEENILTAFDSADRLVSEIGGSKEISDLAVTLQERIIKNLNPAPEKNLKNFLTEADITLLKTELGEETAEALFIFNPWVLTLSITETIYQKAGLNGQNGIDFYLMARAGTKQIEALEAGEKQIDVLSMGTFEEQLDILKNTLEELRNPEKGIKQIEKLKRFYLSNNHEALEKLLKETMTVPENISAQSSKQFIDALLKDRNIVWAKKFEDYLQSGGTTFIFAGAGHFLGEENVFMQMRKNGTLE